MIVLCIGVILIIYSIISYKTGKYDLNFAFTFVFLIMGFQSGVEGDFYRYKIDFETLGLSDSLIRKGEYFWLYLTYYFRQFSSFHVFICLMSLFECYCVKKFVERFSDESFIFISAVLFFFTMNFMCMQMKALRQGLAVDMCLLSFVMIDNKDKKSLILAVLLSLASYFTHKSSLICIVFVLLYWLYIQNQKQLRQKQKEKRHDRHISIRLAFIGTFGGDFFLHIFYKAEMYQHSQSEGAACHRR